MNSVKSKSEIQPTSQVQDGGFGRSAIRVPFLLQRLAALTVVLLTLLPRVTGAASSARFDGQHYRGVGDTEYLQLLETARRMFQPDARLQNLAHALHARVEWIG
ncbi:MAG: hypothetical protein V9H26_21380 [Verrucomicrobiota bacterium]